MQVICNNRNVHVHTNKIYNKRAVFLDLSCAGFCSTIACTGYSCHFNLTFILLLIVDVRGSMKLFEANEFIVNRSLGRTETVSYGSTNDISETFSAMRLRIEVRKLHV